MLPFYSEEGVQRDVVVELDIIKTACKKNIDKGLVLGVVSILRRQMEILSLLDLVELERGNWAFVSFPASLVGRSLLSTLSTSGSLFSPDYWEQGEHRPDEVKEEQRVLLHRMETERLRLNKQASPIRTVHVAWGLLRWGEKFLFYRREDRRRSGEKGYGMIGGRFNLSDLPLEVRSRMGILAEVFKQDSEVVAKHIDSTLQRELKEETRMLMGKHYTFERFGQALPPYKEVNGAGNRHAYTAYIFHLFHINLTPKGETHLLSEIAKDDRLAWFSSAEVSAPQRADGAAAYVDALHHAWGEELGKILSSVPAAVGSPRLSGESSTLDLPGSPEDGLQVGKPGKEKNIPFIKALTQEEWQLLMLLGWHVREFGIELTNDVEVRLLGNGWVDAPGMVPLARCLIGKFPAAVYDLLEIREDRFLSLRVDPKILYWTPALFEYQIQGSNKVGGVFRLYRRSVETIWGCLSGAIYERSLNGNTVAALRALEKGEDPPVGKDWGRSLNEQLLHDVKAIGLRRPWSLKGNVASLVEGLGRMKTGALR